MKTKIEVLAVENKSGRSKAGQDYSLDICQCVVYSVDSDGAIKRLIGELVLPKNHPKVTEGVYEGEFGLSIGQDKRIGGRLLQLTPIRAAAAIPVAGAALKP